MVIPHLVHARRSPVDVLRRTVTLLFLAPLLACGRGGTDRVLLVTIDTLRADHLGSYGYEPAQTPVLDALAARGVRFDQAISPAPLTLPSHATIMTGRTPPEHGVRVNGLHRLHDSIPTAAEQFQQAGYATAAFVGANVLDTHFGLARGFDHYDDRVHARRAVPGQGYAERTADEVVDAALGWLQSAPPRAFAWVHFYDPHTGYRAPAHYQERFPDAPYDAEIAFVDAELGRLFEGISKRWPAGERLVVVTADHGESLGEHGERTHAHFVYDSTQRVPLIVSGAGVAPGGVVDSTVRLVDVAPTLLDLAGLEPLDGASGRSLRPLLEGGTDTERIAYVEAIGPQINFGWSPLVGVRTREHKYIRAPRPELYDLADDPSELDNRFSHEPALAAELDAVVSERLARARPAEAEVLPLELRRRLASLGYLDTQAVSDGSVGRVGGADPKDKLAVMQAVGEAINHQGAGQHLAAIAVLAPFEEPSTTVALVRARSLIFAGQLVQAERELARAIALSPGRYEGPYLLGVLRARQGRADEAVAQLEEAARRMPSESAPWETMGEIAELSGDPATAERRYLAAIEAQSGSTLARARLAALYLDSGRYSEAEVIMAGLSEPLELPPKHLARLARAEHRAGFYDRALERLRQGLDSHPEAPELRRALQELSRPAIPEA